MQLNLLSEYALSVGGEPAEEVVKELHGKKKVNEFNIAKKLNLTINQTRNVLYKLADEGWVSFIRKKDKKKGGWYIYYWTLEIGKGLQKMNELLIKRIEAIRERLEKRSGERFYHCKECSIEYDEENSLLNDYLCLECGGLLELKGAEEELEFLEEEVKKLEGQLEGVGKELKEWEDKEGKKRMRKARDVEKKKAAERKERRIKAAEKRAATKKANEKAANKAGKKTVKKKAAKKKTTKKKTTKKKAVKKKAAKKKTGKKKIVKKTSVRSLVKKLVSRKKK
jgi:transcription factor E